MKEISLQDLLNMADRAAHDGICDLWNQKTIHYLVVFTSPDQDFEIIGAGPALPCVTLEDAAKHEIPGKAAELYVKCPAALAGKLQPKLAPKHLSTPARVPTIPTVKGKSAVPFTASALKIVPKPEAAAPPELNPTPQTPANAEAPAAAPPPAVKPDAPTPQPDPAQVAAVDLAPRLAALAQREKELIALAAALKTRETAVKQREDAAAAREEKLLMPPNPPA